MGKGIEVLCESVVVVGSVSEEGLYKSSLKLWSLVAFISEHRPAQIKAFKKPHLN